MFPIIKIRRAQDLKCMKFTNNYINSIWVAIKIGGEAAMVWFLHGCNRVLYYIIMTGIIVAAPITQIQNAVSLPPLVPDMLDWYTYTGNSSHDNL